MNSGLDELVKAIKNDDVKHIRKIIQNNSVYEMKDIFDFTQVFLPKIDKCDIVLSGEGGSKTPKINATSILALYLALAGFKVLKNSSKAVTSLNGGTDFYASLNLINKQVKIGNGTLYSYDINYSQPYIKYYNLLIENRSFKHFFDTCNYNSIPCKYKFCFRKDLESCKKVKDNKEFVNVEHNYLLTAYNCGKFIDEIGFGTIYVNFEKFIKLNSYPFDDLSKTDIIKINLSLIKGEYDYPKWVEFLRNSFSVIYMIINNISFEKSAEVFDKLYNEKLLKQILKI